MCVCLVVVLHYSCERIVLCVDIGGLTRYKHVVVCVVIIFVMLICVCCIVIVV